MMNNKLVLGTAQFGLHYGITNTSGKVPFDEVVKIIDLAYRNEVLTFDCASTYGNSEEEVGKVVRNLGHKGFSAVTKVFITEERDLKAHIYSQIEKSLNDLSGLKVTGLMAHHGQQVLKFKEKFVQHLQEAKREFSFSQVGVSVYDDNELQNITKFFRPEIVQIPFNAFNQIFSRSEELSCLLESGCEVHARSLFLQGLLLQVGAPSHSYFSKFKANFDEFSQSASASGLSRLEYNLALGFSQAFVHKLVLGVTSVLELQEILSAATKAQHAQILNFTHLASIDEELINPAKWKV